MSFNPLSVPAKPYIGTPYSLGISICTPLKEAPAAAILTFDWSTYGVSQNNPNAAVNFDLQAMGPANKVSSIRGVYIDNTGSDGSIYVSFPDNNFIVTCPPFSTVWQPILTNVVQGTVIGKGFGTNDTSETRIYLCNTPVNPALTPEIQYTYPQVKCSPTISRGNNIYSNGFCSPAIGDQWQQGSIPFTNGTTTINLFFGPYSQGGLITLTDIYLAYLAQTSGPNSGAITATIKSTGASGILASYAFFANAAMNGNNIIRQISNLQRKLNAAETWQLSLTWGGATQAASALVYEFGFSYSGTSTQTTNTIGNANSVATGQHTLNSLYAGIRFTAPATAQILNSVWTAISGVGGRNYHIELWTDNAGNPGALVMASLSTLGPIGGGQLQFNFASPPPINSGSAYWLVLVPEAIGSENSTWSSTNAPTVLGSGRGAAIAALAAGQIADTWLASFTYQTL